MLKVIIYAYMNNIYSCRKIEKLLLRDIHYIWLAGNEHPDFITINRFRNRVKEEINNVFTQLVLVLADKGFISLDVEYIDGTKIESKANKYTFVWRKTVEENITAAWVPGAFEIPITAQKMAQSGKYDAIICVGAVIRGDTSHYDLVCNESAKGIAQVELATGIPVLFGVITTENIEQAIARAGSKAGNKGYDCALSAIEMVNLMKQL